MEKLTRLLKELTTNELVYINTFNGKAIFLNQHGFYNLVDLCAIDCEGVYLHSLLNLDAVRIEVIQAKNNISLEAAQVGFIS